ncbi:antiviral reverse transcriptase Drt3b [Aeromonas caviae]
MNSNCNHVRRDDIYRVIATDTLPYETPVFFSNDGLYNICKKSNHLTDIGRYIYDMLVEGKERKGNFYTVPFKYKIKKNTNEFRTLSLIHPISQFEMIGFYEKFDRLITHYCSISPFSIRAPQRIASLFFYKNTWENIKKYKGSGVDDIQSDKNTKHSTSYFSYFGHDRLYKFFNSNDFLEIEKKYTSMRTLDVSKCFDSIYTHSISWATKEKQFVKEYLSATTFGDCFDSLMQKANYNETNGILIGPEISRIFAEIIFQKIDTLVLKKLEDDNFKLKNNVDYTIRRYVDDVFIFSTSEIISKIIYECYVGELAKFNLHANSAKSALYQRPFFTPKSRVIREINKAVNDFEEKFLEKHGESLKPKKIHRRDNFIHSFIDAIKVICSNNQVNYEEVSSYLISAFFERIKKLISIELNITEPDVEFDYYQAMSVMLYLMFYFYSISPSVGASYKLCMSIIISSRFSKENFVEHGCAINQLIYDQIVSMLNGSFRERASKIDGFLFLEELNIILSTNELGTDFKLSEQLIAHIFKDAKTYYDFVSCIFLIKDDPQYNSIYDTVTNKINNKLSNMDGILNDTEQACLFLDMISCPYIKPQQKKKWLKEFYRATKKVTQQAQARPTDIEIDNFFIKNDLPYWFVNWKEVDLLNHLEKKELKQAY